MSPMRNVIVSVSFTYTSQLAAARSVGEG
jgi:hypothetical protein